MAAAQFTTVINVPPDPAPLYVGPDTQLNVYAGGIVGDVTARDGGELVVHGGNLRGVKVELGSSADIRGGAVDWLNVSDGTLDLFGGSVGPIDARPNSTVHITGGGQATLKMDAQSPLSIDGGDFRLDGVPIAGLAEVGNTTTQLIPPGSVLSGVLSDGTPFAFGNPQRVVTVDGSEVPGPIMLRSTELPPIGPADIVAATDDVGLGVREGQTVLVHGDGILPDSYKAGRGSTIHVEAGGMVGKHLQAVAADVYIAGGIVDERFRAIAGSTVAITGGRIRNDFQVADGVTVNVSGGTIWDGAYGRMRAYDHSVVNISGGIILPGLRTDSGTVVNISGGEVHGNSGVYFGAARITGGTIDTIEAVHSTVVISGGEFTGSMQAIGSTELTWSGGQINTLRAFADSQIHIVGDAFFLDGVAIPGLDAPGDSLLLNDRNGEQLTGLLASGEDFDVSFAPNLFDPAASLRLSIAGVPGDFDTDVDVDGADFLHWQRGGVGSLTDWQSNYGMSAVPVAATIPEPGLCVLAICGLVSYLLSAISRPLTILRTAARSGWLTRRVA